MCSYNIRPENRDSSGTYPLLTPLSGIRDATSCSEQDPEDNA